MLPSLFISHGAPTIAISDEPAREFLCGFGDQFDRPRAILIVSGHWERNDVGITGGSGQHETIHDFFGFPDALYALRYPAPVASDLAAAIAERLSAQGCKVSIDATRGLDHGAWMPLALMYPQADIPVVQVSINPHADARTHWRLGRALCELRADGVLVIGSGALTHNLGDFRNHRGDAKTIPTPPYAAAFCDWVANAVANGDESALLDWDTQAPQAQRAHPTADHWLPFYVALGAAGQAWRGERVHHGFSYGFIGMDCYRFETSPAADRQ